MSKPISARQQAILDCIQRHIHDKQRPPTIRVIQDTCGITSNSVVSYNLKALETAGYIRRDEGKSNGIRLVNPISAAAPDPALLNLVDLLRDIRDYLEDRADLGDSQAEALLARFSVDLTAPRPGAVA